jgi:hypothetical protein
MKTLDKLRFGRALRSYYVSCQLLHLANCARPSEDNEWGSGQQIEAENAFFGVLEEMGLDLDEFTMNHLKHTTDELIDAGLKWALEQT